MGINKMRVGTLALGLSVLVVLFVCVQSAPQLFHNDQEEASDDFPVEVDVEEPSLPLVRARRGSQLASFGHHHNAYAGAGVSRGGHGHGHSQGRVGPVFTYVRTDHHGNYQFGVRHTTGGHGWGR